MEKNNLIVGIVLALVLGTIAYASNNDIQTKEKIVTKIIDGDTIIVEGGETIRLLGIDTDEKSHKCYNEAKNRLEEILLNKKINLEITGKDPYGRYLAYVKLNEENINLKIIKEGLAVARLNEESLYKNAAEIAIITVINPPSMLETIPFLFEPIIFLLLEINSIININGGATKPLRTAA